MQTYNIRHKYRLHKVSAGETLYSIAQSYNTTEYNIKSLNKTDGDLQAGDMLYIGNLDRVLYIVKPADTLSSVAKKHDITETALCAFNSLTADSPLYIGQRVLV